MIPCIVSSTLNDDIFLAWSDLINIGSLAPYFPEVWSSEEKWLEHRATLTPEQRCRNTKLQRLDPAIEKLFDRYQEVFSENLDGGKTMQIPMDIVLGERIADK